LQQSTRERELGRHNLDLAASGGVQDVRHEGQEVGMSYRVTGLSPEPFRSLFALSDEELALQGVKRVVADADFGFPDRIEISDAGPGESLLLLNYLHQPADTPYRSCHAIFVREREVAPTDLVGEIPPAMRARPLSLRAFDGKDMMVDADLVEGAKAQGLIERFLADPKVAYIHAHYARRGCYAGRIERA
jgi:hypothetical protein